MIWIPWAGMPVAGQVGAEYEQAVPSVRALLEIFVQGNIFEALGLMNTDERLAVVISAAKKFYNFRPPRKILSQPNCISKISGFRFAQIDTTGGSRED